MTDAKVNLLIILKADIKNEKLTTMIKIETHPSTQWIKNELKNVSQARNRVGLSSLSQQKY